jgi:hypothetical protein
MDRREALHRTAGILGATLIGSELFLSACARKATANEILSAADVLLLDEVGETILPETERSPGAKAAKIGLFIKNIVTDCYGEKEQEIFKLGILQLNQLARNHYGSDFMAISANQKHEILNQLDKKARSSTVKNDLHFFRMIKELTLWGYFSSEPGATIALRYSAVPGRYEGCVPYTTGDKAWAT